jgi:hypothetical protein
MGDQSLAAKEPFFLGGVKQQNREGWKGLTILRRVYVFLLYHLFMFISWCMLDVCHNKTLESAWHWVQCSAIHLQSS